MPTFQVTDPTSGRTLRLTGDSPPSEAELEQIFAQQAAPAGPSPIEAERQRILQELAAEVSGPEAFLIGAGRGLTTIGRAVGLAEPEAPVTTAGIEALREQRPITVTGGEIVGEAAPFLPAGVAAGGIRAFAPRVAATAGVGAAETGAIARGQGRDVQEQIEAAGVGGLVAGGIEAVLPIVGRLGGALIRKVTGKAATRPVLDEAGRPTAELQKALDEIGISFDDLSDQAQRLLTQAPDDILPEEAVRKAVLEAEGLDPLKAQVTRNAADFQAQQEAAKTSGRVRDALERQEAILTSRFDQAVLSTSGRVDAPTNTVIDALVGKASFLDQEISDLYRVARDVAPEAKNVEMKNLVEKIRDIAPSDRATGGAVRAVFGELKAKGILDKKGRLVGSVDVDTAEDVRKLMNELFDPQNRFRNAKLRQMKDALDDDVFSAAGTDVFKQGRKAKAQFEKELSRAKVSKFDTRRANLVRDVLENKVSPDTFTSDVVFSKKWRGSDIEQLKNYITTTDEGIKAFDDLRADVLDTIKNKAFIGPEDAAGNRSLSRAALEREVNRIGPAKMKALFNDEERAFLKRMLAVSKVREPVKGTALGRGPSAQAIAKLEKKLADLPILGRLVELVNVDVQGRVALKAKPTSVPRRIGPIEQELRGVAAPIGAAAAAQEQQ